MLPSLIHLVMSTNLTLLVLIPIVLVIQLNGEGDILVRILHQTLLSKHSLSVVEYVQGSPSILIVRTQVLHLMLTQHALKLLTAVSLQNVVEDVHETLAYNPCSTSSITHKILQHALQSIKLLTRVSLNFWMVLKNMGHPKGLTLNQPMTPYGIIAQNDQ